MGFSTNWNNERWSIARQKKKLYEEQTGEDVSVSKFFKNNNEFDDLVHKYEVTFELKHLGEGYEFFIPQESITYYGLSENIETKKKLIENVKAGVSDIFKGNARGWIYKRLIVKVRGLEKQKSNYYDVDINKLKMGDGGYTSNVPKVSVNKQNKNESINSNKYDLNIWI